MFITSIKQLFRRLERVLIFFLLIAAVTALLVFSAASMIETNLQIDAAENQFTTIATVTQHWQQGDEILQADMLNFNGAEYVNGPETRPFLLAYNPELHSTSDAYIADSVHIVVFTPLENMPGGVHIGTIDKLAAKAGYSGDSSGLLGQPLNMLANFLPEEKKTEFIHLLAELNR